MPAVLNHNQQRFVEEYLKDFNATDAYIRAGYEVANRDIAASNGSRLLRNAKVVDAIDRLQAELIDKSDVTGDWVVTRLKMVYSAAMLNEDYPAALKALESLGKHVGIYAEDNRQKTGVSNIESLKAKLAARGMKLDREATPSKN